MGPVQPVLPARRHPDPEHLGPDGHFGRGAVAGAEGVRAGGHRPVEVADHHDAGIKRSGRSRGAVRGHRYGAGGDVLLGYREARYRVYLPAYRWVLENRLTAEIEQLRESARGRVVVLLDYETNGDADDLSALLSHAALVKCYLEGN